MEKDQTLTLRISGSDKRILQQAARTQQVKLSEFVLRIARDKAQDILAQQTQFFLPAPQMKAFLEALDAPPRDIPELRKLLSEPSPWEIDHQPGT